MRDEFPEAIILKPSEMFGREDRFFNHYASKTVSVLVNRWCDLIILQCLCYVNGLVLFFCFTS